MIINNPQRAPPPPPPPPSPSLPLPPSPPISFRCATLHSINLPIGNNNYRRICYWNERAAGWARASLPLARSVLTHPHIYKFRPSSRGSDAKSNGKIIRNGQFFLSYCTRGRHRSLAKVPPRPSAHRTILPYTSIPI